jgi:hypothetical protein
VQTETLSNLPNGKNIHVDAKRHKYLTDIYSTLKKNGYEQHDPIIGIYKIPGIIYLMDGTAPSRAIWSRESDQEFLVSLKYYDGKLENSILILTEECSDKLKEGLQKHGVVFPEDYVLKGSVQYEGYPLTNIFFPEK